MQAPVFLGEVRKGDTLRIPLDWIDDSWDPVAYTVYDNETMEAVPNYTNRTDLDAGPTDFEERILWLVLPVEDQWDTDGNLIHKWEEGNRYTIVVKSAADNVPTDGTGICLVFRVEPINIRAFLGVVEKGKTLHFYHREENRDEMWYDLIDPRDNSFVASNVAMEGPLDLPGGGRYWKGEIDSEGTDDLMIGRTYWVRVKDKRAEDPHVDAIYSFTVLPRLEAELRRLLALSGENMVLDNFTYDQAGNILSLRVRLFSNSTDAANATAGVTDPEPGEIASYDVNQEHDIPRNVRTFHKSVMDFIAGDFPVDK